MLKFWTKITSLSFVIADSVVSFDTACTKSLSNSGSLTTYYDTLNEKIVIQATLPDNSYVDLGWGWGRGRTPMSNADNIIFSASGASSSIETTYHGEEGGEGNVVDEQPKLAQQSCYSYSTNENADGTILLTASRPLECGPYAVKLDSHVPFVVAWGEKNLAISQIEQSNLEYVHYLGSDGTCTAF